MQIQESSVKCTNCLTDNKKEHKFCSSCGQKMMDIKRPIRYFFGEFVDNYLNIDTKLFNTLKLLIFSPGKLTSVFMSGERKKFVPPVRLLVVSSVVFFFLFALSSKKSIGVLDKEMRNSTVDTTKINAKLGAASFSIRGDSIQYLLKMNQQELNKYLNDQSVEPSRLNKIIIRQFARFTQEGPNKFFNQYLKILNISVFLLIPIFALITMLFYRDQLYIYHLIFSIHFHSLFYLVYSLGLSLDLLLTTTLFSRLLFMGLAILLFFWLKTNFTVVRRSKSILKYLSILLMYSLVLTIFITIAAAISFGAF